MSIRLLQGDVRARLADLEPESVQGVATSPPYFQLRAYGTEPQVWGGDPEHAHEWTAAAHFANNSKTSDGRAGFGGTERVRWLESSFCVCGAWRGEYGQEPTPALFVEHTVEWMRAVHRVLRKDGCVLLNIGDSYVGSGKGPSNSISPEAAQIGPSAEKKRNPAQFANGQAPTVWQSIPQGFKAKDLYGIPWRVAFALQDDGWYLRGDYIWHKPAPMPESVTDRCTRSHEYIFHLTKSPRYFWNQDELREPLAPSSVARLGQDVEAQAGSERANGGAKTNGAMKAVRFGGSKGNGQDGARGRTANGNEWENDGKGANKRTVWTINTSGFPEAHFATFPPELAETMVKAISRPGDTVLDPFAGAGTLLLAADRLGRHGIGVELKPEYAQIAQRRLTAEAPLLTELEVA